MAERSVDVLLVGGGVASTTCATELRERGFEGSILMVGRELDAPYDRTQCSKGYLRGRADRDGIALREAGWWDEHGVELLTRTSVMKLDTAAKVARLSTKDEVTYGQALVATGANVRRLNVDGAQLDGIHYLRAPGNADAIHADAEGAARAVVVGGSYLGTELAAALVEMGVEVTVLMQEGVALERHYGATAGGWFQRVLEERGVRFVGADALGSFKAGGAGEDRVGAVVTEGGQRLEGDLVVVAAGAVPDVMLARQSGLELGELGGVRCDAGLRTSAPGVFAAGDMCEWDSPLHGGPARVEHWEVAAAQGRTAARNMLGDGAAHDEVPYFWSDLSDWASSEYVGVVGDGGWDAEVVRGSLEQGRFSIWYLAGGRVVGALAVGRSEDLDHARGLIAARTAVTGDELGDEAADLSSLVS